VTPPTYHGANPLINFVGIDSERVSILEARLSFMPLSKRIR